MPTDLRDPRHFPPFSACPDENDMDFDYYHSVGGYMYHPTRHWCLLAEITHIEHFLRLRLLVKDHSGDTFPVAFYLEDGTPDLSQYRVGDTIAILYAHQHGFLDMTVGVRLEVSYVFQVVRLPLAGLLALSDRVKMQAVLVDGKRACHACGKRENKISKCGRCGFFWYCGDACQRTGWKEKGHKEDCKVLRECKGFFERDWTRFDGFLGFPL